MLNLTCQNKDLGENAVKVPYKIVDDLLYFDNDEKGLRLCVPSSLEEEVFKLAHDEMGHPGYARIHEKLTEGLYIFNMATKLYKFIRHCPHCQLNQTSCHKPYSSLQAILTAVRSFHTLTIDFILALPKSQPDDYNCALGMTDKFSKAITYIPGKTTWGAKEWALAILNRLAEINWGLPRAFISDRDRKFIAEIWKEIFLALKVNLLYSTAWHPQTDGSSERSNQTAKIALRYYIAALKDPRQWPTVLPRMTAALNNSTKYSSTVRATTQVLYGFQTREALDLLRIDNHEATPEHAAEPDENDNATEPNEDTADARLMLSAEYPAVTRNATRQTRSPGTDIPARQRSTPP